MGIGKLGTLAVIAALAASSAFAAETATSSTSTELPAASAAPQAPAGASVTTETGTPIRGALDRLSVHYFTIFHGAVLGDINSPYSVNSKGQVSKSNAMNLDGDLTTSYSLTEQYGVGLVVPFILTPVLGQGATLGDIGVKAFDRSTVASRGFTLSTNLIVQAPTSDYSQNRHMKLALKTTPSAKYAIPASRFTVGAYTEAKAYLAVTEGKTFKLWAGPYVNYQLTPWLSANLQYEMEADHFKGKPTLDFTSYQTDLMPGLIWRITHHVSFNPYVQIYTGNRVTTDTTAVGAVVNATLL